MKILITGGHITPALALIEELKKKRCCEIVFVGRKFALDEEKTLSFEYHSVINLGIRFINLQAGRLTRILSWKSFINFIKFPLAFFQVLKILQKEKPTLIFTFGGYIALPVALVSWIKRIPVFTHEQTMRPGITNRIIGLIARKVFIAFPESVKFFPKEKTVLSGNLLRKCIFQIIKKPFLIKKDKPIIYITGGSLGSHSINLLIEKILPKLIEKFIVIHQTGDTFQYQDYDRLVKIKHSHYFLKKHFFGDEIGYIYSLTDLVIGRAGANTITELIALKKPSILIPLPWSANNEQKIHAQFLKEKGVAEIFFQEKMDTFQLESNANKLYNLIIQTISNLNQLRKNFYYLKDIYKKNAVEIIISHINTKN